jgi:peptidyl-prolyl cis-trans isomerase C
VKRIFVVGLMTIGLGGCNLFSGPALSQKVVLDVNGRQLKSGDFASELAFRLRDQDALSAKDPKLVAVMKEQIIEEFTVQTLTEAWAREKGLVVRAEELEEQIKSVQSSYPDDLAFQQALTEQGMTFKDWRDRLHRTLLQRKVAQQIESEAEPPSDADAQKFYQENKERFLVHETAQVRQVLAATESDAKAIETELKRGKRMTDLAKKYSISPEGPQGGLVGWVEKGISDIFESAFRMRQGQRSPIVKSAFGYHIFEVLSRKPARTKPFNEVRDEIKRILLEKRAQSLYLAWLEEQVRKARIFKDQAFIDAVRVETKSQ